MSKSSGLRALLVASSKSISYFTKKNKILWYLINQIPQYFVFFCEYCRASLFHGTDQNGVECMHEAAGLLSLFSQPWPAKHESPVESLTTRVAVYQPRTEKVNELGSLLFKKKHKLRRYPRLDHSVASSASGIHGAWNIVGLLEASGGLGTSQVISWIWQEGRLHVRRARPGSLGVP